jgi:hypothetical protein
MNKLDLGSIFEKDSKKVNNAKINSVPTKEIEEYPFEKQFGQFLKLARTMDADKDVVSGKPREYVSTAQLTQIYDSTFEDVAVAKGTIQYRINQIKPEEFPDDFIVLPTERVNEEKYFVNRLNTELLKRIYMPDTGAEFRNMVENVQAQHSDLKASQDLNLAQSGLYVPRKPTELPHDEEFHSEHEYLSEDD